MSRFILILIIFCGVALAAPVFAAGQLIKSDDSPAVYYLSEDNIRHLFPTRNTYMTWYDDFSGLEIMSHDEISQHSLGNNVTVRPGVTIATFETDSNYYGVEPGGVLRLFASDQVMKDMYGARWYQKVVELPDGFFENYSLGEEIDHVNDLPDGTVYKSVSKGEYYYKDKGIAWLFANSSALRANNFSLSDVVTTKAIFDARVKKVDKFNDYIFNPAAEPQLATNDCENKDFKVAFLLASKDGYSNEDLTKIDTVRRKLPTNFKWATYELASMDVDEPIVILDGDEDALFLDVDGQHKTANEIINIFYDSNEDIFDFIILYNNFIENEPEMANYLTVTNDFTGTGNVMLHGAKRFGSLGKLKGIANMGNIDKYSIDGTANIDESVNYVIHEIMHHFSGRARFTDSSGQVSHDLLRPSDLSHWSRYMNFVSPLGGNNWQDNNDGTYTNLGSSSFKKRLSGLDLYFMGLLPQITVGNAEYLVPGNPNTDGNTIAGQMVEVSIDQIVDTMRGWRCRLEQ